MRAVQRHAHRHDDIDGRTVAAFADQRRVARTVEQKTAFSRSILAGDLMQVFGVEADSQRLVGIGDGQFFIGGAGIRGVHRQDQPILFRGQLDGARPFAADVATRSTALAKSPASTSSLRAVPRGNHAAVIGNVPSITFEVR